MEPTNGAVQLKKKSKGKKYVLIILGAIIIIALTGCGFALYKAKTLGSTLEPTVVKFIDLLSRGAYSEAYDMYASSAKEQLTFDKFKEAADDMKPLLVGIQKVTQTGAHYNIGEKTTFTYNGQIIYADGSKSQVIATFVKDGKDWELYGFKVRGDLDKIKNNLPN